MNLQPVVDLQLIPSIDDTLGVGDNNASFLIASIWKAEAEVSLSQKLLHGWQYVTIY